MPIMRDMLTPEVLAALDRFMAAQEERQSLPETVNGILMDWLTARGCLPVEELPDGDE